MRLAILNQQKFLKIRPKLIEKLVDLVLEDEPKNLEVSVCFVGDKAITKLNEKYLHHIGPTDVIAFPMREGSFNKLHREILGDVVISTQRAIDQAAFYKKGIGEELCLYVVHGILHLLGYDDTAAVPRRRMEKKQEALLQSAREYYGNDFFARAAGMNHPGGK